MFPLFPAAVVQFFVLFNSLSVRYFCKHFTPNSEQQRISRFILWGQNHTAVQPIAFYDISVWVKRVDDHLVICAVVALYVYSMSHDVRVL